MKYREASFWFDSLGAGRSPSAARGYGLFHIAEQIEHLGGCVAFNSGPGGGTQVVVETPGGGGHGEA